MESIQVFGRASLNKREEKEVHKTETRKPTAQPLHVIVEDKDYQLHAKVKAVAVSAAEILSHAPALQGTTVNTQASVQKTW